MTDLNKLYDLTSPKSRAMARDGEERLRIELRTYLKRAVAYIDQMGEEQADWPQRIAECNALCDLTEAGRIAGDLYKDFVLPRAQAAAPPPPRRERRDVEAYEDRLEQEGYSS